jgi:transposase
LTKVGVEGTGSYGAGLSKFLARAGISVVEVNRPNREERRRSGKSDPLDAIETARAALGGKAKSIAKSKDGPVEAVRALLVAKRSARTARTSALIQMRELLVTGPDQLRSRLRGLSISDSSLFCPLFAPHQKFSLTSDRNAATGSDIRRPTPARYPAFSIGRFDDIRLK